jgi:predicted flap endonuclease-1-like 5' DNA nuclease
MPQDSQDISRLLQDLHTHSATQQLRVTQRYHELLQLTLRGELDEQSLRQRYTEFIREEPTRYLQDLIELGIKFYAALLELSGNYNDRFFEQILGATTRSSTPSAPRAAQPRRVEMELRAPVEQDATRSFIVENKRAETVEVTFLVSEFVGAAGTVPFRPPLQLEPPRFTLGPGEQRLVTLKLPLLAELFTPGEHYTATIAASGYDDLVLDLSVWVEAPPDAAGASFRPVASAAKTDESATASEPSSPSDFAVVGDDLTRIKGIGPRYAEKLRKSGITTFTQLAAVDNQLLAEILGPLALRRAERDEWLAQASVAAAADEAEVKNLQIGLVRSQGPQSNAR